MVCAKRQTTTENGMGWKICTCSGSIEGVTSFDATATVFEGAMTTIDGWEARLVCSGWEISVYTISAGTRDMVGGGPESLDCRPEFFWCRDHVGGSRAPVPMGPCISADRGVGFGEGRSSTAAIAPVEVTQISENRHDCLLIRQETNSRQESFKEPWEISRCNVAIQLHARQLAALTRLVV